jgi:hypothetical protein
MTAEIWGWMWNYLFSVSVTARMANCLMMLPGNESEHADSFCLTKRGIGKPRNMADITIPDLPKANRNPIHHHHNTLYIRCYSPNPTNHNPPKDPKPTQDNTSTAYTNRRESHDHSRYAMCSPWLDVVTCPSQRSQILKFRLPEDSLPGFVRLPFGLNILNRERGYLVRAVHRGLRP